MGADFKNLLRFAYGDKFSKGNTHPVPSGTPSTVGHVWGMLKGLKMSKRSIQRLERVHCSLNLSELGLVISDCFCTPRPVLQRFPQTSISVF